MPTRYQVSKWGCRTSRVRHIRSNLPTRKQVHAYLVSGGDFRISRVRNTRLNVPMRCQNGVALSHGLGTQDRKCLQGIRMRLLDLTGSANQDFTDKEHQIEPAYTVSGRGCRISSYIDRTCLLGTRSGLQDLTGSKHRSNVPITCRCQDGVA